MEKALTIADNLRIHANGKLRIPSKDCAVIADLLTEFLNTPMAHLGTYPEHEQQVFLLCMQRLIEVKQHLYKSYDLGRNATIRLDMAAAIGFQLAVPDGIGFSYVLEATAQVLCNITYNIPKLH